MGKAFIVLLPIFFFFIPQTKHLKHAIFHHRKIWRLLCLGYIGHLSAEMLALSLAELLSNLKHSYFFVIILVPNIFQKGS